MNRFEYLFKMYNCFDEWIRIVILNTDIVIHYLLENNLIVITN